MLGRYYDVRDHLCLSVDFENQVEDPLDPRGRVKKLVELCSCKVVSDSSFLSHLNILPKSIYIKLLSAALEQNRILSVVKLIRFCPQEELTLPFPSFSTHWKALTEMEKLDKCFEKFYHNASTMLATFFSIIKEGSGSCKLRILNLNVIPIDFCFLPDFLKHLKEIARYKRNNKEYVLKFSTLLSRNFERIFIIIEKAESLGIHIVLTGLEIHNCRIDQATALKVFDILDPLELLALSLTFVRFESIKTVLEKIKNFKKLKYFRFRYVDTESDKNSILDTLFGSLSELPEISRIVFNGCNLHNRAASLFKKPCLQPTNKPKTDSENCCLVHNGKLEYLDISSCQLSDDDIEFVQELSVWNSIKYLDLGSNCFKRFRKMNILTSLKTSLVVLNISYAFPFQIVNDFNVLPFSEFNHLKYLNLDKMVMDETSQQFFAEERLKAPNLIIVWDFLKA